MNDNEYLAIKWRKKMEQRGWISYSRAKPPASGMYEYHAIYRGRLHSGRAERDFTKINTPGTPDYFYHHRTGQAVWRHCKTGKIGRVIRQLPWRI